MSGISVFRQMNKTTIVQNSTEGKQSLEAATWLGNMRMVQSLTPWLSSDQEADHILLQILNI